MSENVDYVEVDRKAHELGERHGPLAYEYASKLAEAASAQENEERLFWKAVAASLQPR